MGVSHVHRPARCPDWIASCLVRFIRHRSTVQQECRAVQTIPCQMSKPRQQAWAGASPSPTPVKQHVNLQAPPGPAYPFMDELSRQSRHRCVDHSYGLRTIASVMRTTASVDTPPHRNLGQTGRRHQAPSPPAGRVRAPPSSRPAQAVCPWPQHFTAEQRAARPSLNRERRGGSQPANSAAAGSRGAQAFPGAAPGLLGRGQGPGPAGRCLPPIRLRPRNTSPEAPGPGGRQ